MPIGTHAAALRGAAGQSGGEEFGANDNLLLEDGTSNLLLEDGTSVLLLEGSTG